MSKRTRGKSKRKHQLMRRFIVPNKGVVAEYHAHMQSVARGEITPVIPPGYILQLAEKFENVVRLPDEVDPCPPFIRVLLKLWKSDRHQGIAAFHHIVMRHPKYGLLKLFFSGNEWLCWQDTKHDARYSVTYNGKPAAIRAFDRNRIIWIERVSVTRVSPPPPAL